MKVKKSTLTYGEAFDINKKHKEEAALKKEKELQASCSQDDNFDVSLGAMIGSMMAIDDENNDTNSCDTTTNCDISSSFDSDF